MSDNAPKTWRAQWALAIGASMVMAGAAGAQITYVSQTRLVSAETDAGLQSFSSVAVGPWSQSASSHNPFGSSSAYANQTSELRSNAILFDLDAVAGNSNGFLARSESRVSATFSLAAPTSYELVMTNPSLGETGGLRLLMGSTTIFSFNVTQVPLVLAGELQPGTYQFTAYALGVSFSGSTPPDEGGQARGVLYIPSPASTAVVALGALVLRRRR